MTWPFAPKTSLPVAYCSMSCRYDALARRELDKALRYGRRFV